MKIFRSFQFVLVVSMTFLTVHAFGQDADSLLAKVRAKLAGVSDYTAEGIMKTDVSFMKVPDARITVYFKQPDRFKIRKQDGISIMPKGGVNINLTTLFAGNRYTAVGAGKAAVNGTAVAVVKLLPLDEQSDVVVSTLYIDEKEYLIRKAVITTRENGTYEMEMSYGKYANRGLPDKVSFIFSTKDYKLPKGLAIDYDAGEKPRNTTTNEKGKIEISYTSYAINTGLSNDIFN
jgi:hypothetical protein